MFSGTATVSQSGVCVRLAPVERGMVPWGGTATVVCRPAWCPEFVADQATGQRPWLALQVDELMASRASVLVAMACVLSWQPSQRHAAVAGGHAVEGLILRALRLVVATVAARFVEPRLAILRHLLHVAVTVDARRAVLRGHDIAQALGRRAGWQL